jgi:hypothetical protein
MSVSEQIFFHADATVVQAARALAGALDFEMIRDDDHVRLARTGFAGVDGRVAGRVDVNFYAEPDNEPAQRTAFDQYPLVWDLFVAGYEPDRQRAVARALFEAITKRLGWPALLVHDLSMAVADWHPDRGLRQFPDNTLIDSASRAVWDA